MAIIYHVTTADAWAAAQQQGFYTAHSLEKEGFIHCSEAYQVRGVLQRYYAGQRNLVKLAIDTNKLTSLLRYDHSPSVNEAFPHIYGAINVEAVTAAEPLLAD